MGRILTLGEIMLRLSTNEGTRITEANYFKAHYGGSEANVAINLANFNHQVSFASKVPSNLLGKAVQQHLQNYGVDTSNLLKGGLRLGTYYLERGTGKRASLVLYDRTYSSFAQMKNVEWNIDDLFKNVSLFHVSGISLALSDSMTNLILGLIKEAKKRQIKVSFDINYRSNLWNYERASKTLNKILPYVDYCSAGKKDALYLIGIPENKTQQSDLEYYYEQMHNKYPNIEVFYSTLRDVHSASSNDLQGTLWKNHFLYTSKVYHINPIVDRVGGGDAFVAGILHGLLKEKDPDYTVSFATAASSLKHTIHGDCNQFSILEVEEFMRNESGNIIR
ncbi:sugar kinase (plasmid) [Bacillus cereus]|uniref:2-dehydro-3-deoxygluconokinase n=1 Tax=Bacillus cereus (strain ZK / E33L) TaxID=288681 RepID=Q4V1C2_BACCZ|nr:sugar kinase [Bacillus cereus]AAY60485.1 2-dehydro-3-deoxygluconokinase [Bacillus cereus E33L]AJI25986.1 pfkB carbohydrate kinase family protein [Bacillus cereus E33L]QQA19257.1 sugar kinase [Bacillus cereus]